MQTGAGRGRSCGWLAAVAGVVMGMTGTVDLAFAGPGPTLSVSPTNIAWTSNTWVTLTVGNLVAGESVRLGLFVDVEGNGVVDAMDPLIAAYLLQDGRTNELGSSIIVDDEDGAANGTLVSRVAYFGQEGPLHVVGHYLWSARTVSDGAATTARFAVTQPTSTVWLTGSVVDYVTSGAVTGAVVHAECFTDTAMPEVWTDTNGAFRLYLPNGVSTSDVAEISAIGLGYFNPSKDQTETEPVSTYVFTNDLRLGANPLPITLRVVPAIPGAIHEVSGHVYAPGSTPVPGVLVNIEWDDDGWVTAITDTNGLYRLCVPDISSSEANLYTDPASLAGLGLVAVGRGLMVTQNMANVDLVCPAATLLVCGRVLAADDEEPIAGSIVALGGDMFGGQGVSLTDGTYQVGVIPYDNYTADVEGQQELGFLDAPDVEGLSITDNSWTNLDFRFERGYPITGVVYDSQTNALSGGVVGAYRYPVYRRGWQYRTDNLNRHGAYCLLAPTGALALVANEFPGFVGQTYANHFEWEQDENGMLADPVVNTPAGTNGIDFYLSRAAQIRGVVRGDSAPLPGMWVSVSERFGDDWDRRAGGETDENGCYSLDVPPGSNYIVEVQSPEGEGLFWVSQYYGGTSDGSSAALVAAAVDAPATGIDFDLEEGGIISGRVFEEDGVAPVEDCPVKAETLDESYDTDSNTDENGYFTIVVPPGTYRVEARPDWDDLPFVRQYFSNTTSEAEAMELDMVSGGIRSNVDFRLSQACMIAGYVYHEDGTTPLEDCHVFASDYDSNDWMAGNNTDDEGRYTLWLPPGTYRVRAVPAEEGLRFESKFYDDTYRYDEAEPVTIGEGSDRDGVNFTLAPAGTISGHIRVGTTPLEDCHIGAEDYTTGEWMAWDNTESDGSYQLVLPAGTYRVVARPSNDDLPYMDAYYDDVFAWEDAEPVVVKGTDDTPGIDFQLQPGGTLSGHVYQEDGVTPLANCRVCADDPDTGQWRAEDQTEDDGAYSLRLPAGSYVVRAKPTQDNLPFADQHYSNAANRADATLVTVVVSNNTPNIDFTLSSGCTISGYVYGEDGSNVLVNCHVSASDYDSNNWMAGDNTDDEGHYRLRLPVGTYRVRAFPAQNGLLYESRFYSNTYYYGGAVPVAVDESNNAEGIDFVLGRAGTVSGHIYTGAGNTALENCHIGAEESMSGEWMGWDNSAPDGSYTLVLPAGTYRVVARPSNSGLPYVDLFHENTPFRYAAEPVEVRVAVDEPGIDFHLMAGGVISGHVYREDGAGSLAGCHVYAEDNASGSWMAGCNTDASGYYSFMVPTGIIYRVRAAPNIHNLPYTDEWFNDVVNGMPWGVPVMSASGVSGIDFTLMVKDLAYGDWRSHYFTTAELADWDIGGDDADPDHDGADNLEEYAADTDPRGSNSVLRVTNHGPDGGGLKINWQGGRWARQYLQRSDTLHAADGDWTTLLNSESLPTVVSNFFSDYDGAPGPCFYRIKVERDPAPR